jgi:hypothetical protein
MTKRANVPQHVLKQSHTGSVRYKAVAKFASLAVAGLVLFGTPARATEEVAVSEPAVEATACPGAGTIWWSELLAPETDKLTEFYASVVGWTTKVVDVENQAQAPVNPDDRYTIFSNGTSETAGLMKANHPGAVHSGVGWFTYIQVADVDASVAKATAGGGTVLRQPAETQDGHRIAVVSDPMGNVFGLVTPAKKC